MTSTTSMTRKRERSFVNKKFQICFILLVFAPILLNAIIFFVAKDVMFQQKMALGEQLGLPSDNGYFELLQIQESTETKVIIFSSIASAFIFLAWALYISHRIAGPLYRLTQDLNNAQPNEGMKHVHFRPSDFFQEVPVALNAFLDRNNLTNKK
jgi:predicted small integral membrane protein